MNMGEPKYEVCILAKGGESFLSEVALLRLASELEKSRLRALATEEDGVVIRIRRNQKTGKSSSEPV